MIASGAEKIIEPYQNFLFVIQSYQLPGIIGGEGVAVILPWVEFFIGIFLAGGLWLRWALLGQMVLTAAFIIVVAQALIRHLPIDECGCFGEFISLPLPVVLGLDMTLLFLGGLLYDKIEKTQRLSLDRFFLKDAVR